jgi:hypothetical protein
MSRMGELAINRQNLEVSFIGFMRELFSRKGFQEVDRTSRFDPTRGFEPDLLLADHAPEERLLIELKLYDYDRAPVTLLQRAVDYVARAMPLLDAPKAIVIVTAALSPRAAQMPLPDGVEIWDVHRLADETKPYPDLAADLADLLREAQVGALGGGVLPQGLADLLQALDPPAPISQAEAIIARLSKLQPGRADATKFEKACEAAIMHLYGESFGGWRSQSRIESGFHRLDCVARLTPAAGFWATMATDFRSRYVIFEFKNYTDPISQDEIYTTEKYLFTAALRAIAIIVARNGASESATRAVKGALREQGKLILCLSLNDLVELLRKSELGDDPTRLLTERLDDLLLDIAR